MEHSREDFPRVSVDGCQDWQRVRSNFADAFRRKLDERLTTLKLTEQQDFLQPYVQQVRLGVFSTCVTSMVYLPVQFIDRTFEMTKPNLRINGRTVEEDGTEGTFGEGGSVVPSPFCLSDVSLE